MSTCKRCKLLFYEDTGEMADPRDICSCSSKELQEDPEGILLELQS